MGNKWVMRGKQDNGTEVEVVTRPTGIIESTTPAGLLNPDRDLLLGFNDSSASAAQSDLVNKQGSQPKVTYDAATEEGISVVGLRPQVTYLNRGDFLMRVTVTSFTPFA